MIILTSLGRFDMSRTSLSSVVRIAVVVALSLAPAAARAQEQVEITWTTGADMWRGVYSRTINVYCPTGGKAGTVWGTTIHTDDSSVCTAAVHVLATFDFARGGTVYLSMAPGQEGFDADARRGVSTQTYGSWPGSFRVVGGVPGKRAAEIADTTPIEITWSTNARFVRGLTGATRTLLCPRRGALAPVWGNTIYTDESSICAAAVHAGLIKPDSGGGVTIRVEPGREGYVAATRNGVASQPWEKWDGSFSFPNGQRVLALAPAPPEPPASVRPAGGFAFVAGVAATPPAPPTLGPAGELLIDWRTTATEWRTQPDRLLTFYCPPGGTGRTVWGSGPYTDDSGVCTAAVHALATFDFARGGTVTIAMAPGRAAYDGTRRRNFETMPYESFPGSFVVLSGVPGLRASEVNDSTLTEISWTTTAAHLRTKTGTRPFVCPAEGRAQLIWGVDVYADYSSICSAALHAGLITATTGGPVTVRLEPGRASYDGAVRNAATSQAAAAGVGSFTFVR